LHQVGINPTIASMNTNIHKAISKLGGNRKAAIHLKAASGMECTRDMVASWRNKIGVPAKWALWVERETGISRHLLCNTPLPTESIVVISENYNGTNVEQRELKETINQ